MLNSETLQIEASLVDPFGLYAGNPVTGNLSLSANSEQIQLIDTPEQIQTSDDLFVADINWEGSALDVRLKIEADDMVALSDPIDVLDGLGPSFSILEGLWNGDKNGLVLFSMDVPQIWQFDPKTGNGLGTIQLPSRASFVQHDIINQVVWVGLERSIEPSGDSIVGDEIIALINLDTFQLEKTIQVDIGERNAVREVHPAPGNTENTDTLLAYADFKRSENPALMLIGSETGVLDTIPLPDHFLNAELVPGKLLGQYFLHARESIVPLSASSMSININLEEAKTLTPIAAEHFQTSHSLTWIGNQLLRQTGEIIDPSALEVVGKLVDENILAVVPFQDNQTVALLKDDLEVLYYNLDSQDIELNFTLPRLYFGSPPYVEPGRALEHQFNIQKGVALRAWGEKGLVVFENNDWRRFTDQNCVFFDGPVSNPASQQIVSIDSAGADSQAKEYELHVEPLATTSDYAFAGVNTESNSLGSLSAEEPESRILIFQDVTASEHELGEVSGIIGMVNHAFSEYTQIGVNVVPVTSQENDFLTLTPTYDFLAGDILGNVFTHPGLLVVDDAVPELDEVFRLEFVDTNYNYVVDSTTITIINDDFPEISVLSKPFGKRKSGVYDAEILVKLSEPAPFPSEVYYQTIPGSALPGEDYFHREGMLTFEPGETEKSVFIPLIGGETDQQIEEFGMQFLYTKGAVYTQPDPSFQIVAVSTGSEVALALRWLNESTLEIAFESTADWTYELKTTDNLVNGEWTKVGGTLNGNGAPIKLFVPVVEGQHFFRVELRIP